MYSCGLLLCWNHLLCYISLTPITSILFLFRFLLHYSTLDLLIQEKEKIYIELKNVLSRQPGPEVEENILMYQQTYKDKTKQLQSMNQELSMYIEQVAKFKGDIVTIDQQAGKLSKKWMKTRRLKETQM